jgi:membrane-bound lytic murein transglycosylase B
MHTTPSCWFSPVHFCPAAFFVALLTLISLSLVPVSVFATPPKAADLVKNGQAIDLAQDKYQQLFQELEQQHQFSPAQLQEIFKGQVIKKRVLELMDSQWEAKPYYKYYPLFITRKTIAKGKKKLKKHRELLDKVEQQFGVDREIVIAIWAIETHYGSNQGGFNVLQTLNTINFMREKKIYYS